MNHIRQHKMTIASSRIIVCEKRAREECLDFQKTGRIWVATTQFLLLDGSPFESVLKAANYLRLRTTVLNRVRAIDSGSLSLLDALIFAHLGLKFNKSNIDVTDLHTALSFSAFKVASCYSKFLNPLILVPFLFQSWTFSKYSHDTRELTFCQCHQHFKSSFCANILEPNNFKAKL